MPKTYKEQALAVRLFDRSGADAAHIAYHARIGTRPAADVATRVELLEMAEELDKQVRVPVNFTTTMDCCGAHCNTVSYMARDCEERCEPGFAGACCACLCGDDDA